MATIPDPTLIPTVGKFVVTLITAQNGIIQIATDKPWTVIRARWGNDIWVEQTGHFPPWSTRFLNDRGDIIIIDMPGGTLD